MRSLAFLFLMVISFSTFAQTGSITKKILKRLPFGVHTGADCEVSVLDDSAIKAIKIVLNVGDEYVTEFNFNEKDQNQEIIRDASTATTIDVTVRRRAGKYQRLVINKTTVSVYQLKRGVSGRMNTIDAMSCDLD
jgi:hypothetical protein